VARHEKYSFAKQVVGPSESGNADGAIRFASAAQDDVVISGNTIENVVSGINTYGQRAMIHDNHLSGLSSIGIFFHYASDSTQVYDNYIKDCNIPLRFGSVDRADEAGRKFFIYRNRIYNPENGVGIYVHYDGSAASTTKAYFYHNSFVNEESRCLTWSGYGDDTGDSTGFMFVNNIISSVEPALYLTFSIGDTADFVIWDYNWVSGTYGASNTAVWAPVPHNIHYPGGPTFWSNQDTQEPDFTNIKGTEVIDAGIDITQPFTIDGVEYPALPGDFSYKGNGPDIGYYEWPTLYITPYVGGKPLFINNKRVTR